MAETDIARVVSMIMENPELVEQIKGMAAKEKENEPTGEIEKSEDAQANEVHEAVAIHTEARPSPRRRGELLEALKPYMSDERKKALDSFVAIADVLDMMRSK